MRMPPRDILESYQNPSVESQSGMRAKSGRYAGSKAKVHHTAPSYHAQAGSATSFYIFTGRVGNSDVCIVFSPGKKNENHENCDPGFLPGKASPLMRKLDHLLAAAVKVCGIVPKYSIVPVVLVQGKWITDTEVSKLGLHSSLVFAIHRFLRRILLAALGARLLTNHHRDGTRRAHKICRSFPISSGGGHFGPLGYTIFRGTWGPFFPLAICRVLVATVGGAVRR